jgi:hypothetical protein
MSWNPLNGGVQSLVKLFAFDEHKYLYVGGRKPLDSANNIITKYYGVSFSPISSTPDLSGTACNAIVSDLHP